VIRLEVLGTDAAFAKATPRFTESSTTLYDKEVDITKRNRIGKGNKSKKFSRCDVIKAQ
jgi:hypothetical protein